jgi:hypothetical protein
MKSAIGVGVGNLFGLLVDRGCYGGSLDWLAVCLNDADEGGCGRWRGAEEGSSIDYGRDYQGDGSDRGGPDRRFYG